jgi:hypothetical protein
MDAPSFTGSDDRGIGSGGDAKMSAVFWRMYDFAVRNNCVAEFLSIYQPLPTFRDLVAEADRREQQRIRGAA